MNRKERKAIAKRHKALRSSAYFVVNKVGWS